MCLKVQCVKWDETEISSVQILDCSAHKCEYFRSDDVKMETISFAAFFVSLFVKVKLAKHALWMAGFFL